MAPKKEQSHAKISVDEVDDERTQLSKHISWVLRRGAAQSGIDIDPKGFVKIADLLKYKELKGLSEEKLLQVLEQSNSKKSRYDISADKKYCRAYKKVERAELNEKFYSPDASAAAAMSSMGAYNPYWAMGGMMPFMNPFMGYGMGYGWQQAAAHAAMAARHTGIIKSFNAEKGFGFIECTQTFAMYQRDVFLQKSQIGNMNPGQGVTFTLEVNKNGMPQAKDVQPYGAAGGKGYGGKGKGKGKGNGEGEKGETKGQGKGKKHKEQKDDEGNEASETKPEGEAAKAPEAAAEGPS